MLVLGHTLRSHTHTHHPAAWHTLTAGRTGKATFAALVTIVYRTPETGATSGANTKASPHPCSLQSLGTL